MEPPPEVKWQVFSFLGELGVELSRSAVLTQGFMLARWHSVA
jgi:hypothetical protein